jgi:hypothetical protein
MATTDEQARRCPECGAPLNPGESQCWLCHRPDIIKAELVGGPAPPPAAGPLQFSIQTLLLVTTLVAVCLGALVAVPGLGALAIVIAIPAIVRTCVTGAAMKREGHTLTATDKVMAFLASAAITWAAIAAACVAICATCTVTLFTGMAIGEAAGGNAPFAQSFSEIIIWIGFVLCCAAGLGAFIGMFWITRPYIP